MWHSGCAMDCHTAARVQFGKQCENRASCHSQGTVNRGAVSKWPCCPWDVKHNQPINPSSCGIIKLKWVLCLDIHYSYIMKFCNFLRVKCNFQHLRSDCRGQNWQNYPWISAVGQSFKLVVHTTSFVRNLQYHKFNQKKEIGIFKVDH